MKKNIRYCFLILVLISCKKTENENTVINNTLTDTIIPEIIEKPVKQSIQSLKKELREKGFETFDFVDKTTKDTILMQKYFMVFLKSGSIRSQNEEEAELLQAEHLAHLSNMYKLGYADISGPFADNSTLRGITIYNVPTLKMADSLASADPMVKAGYLDIEIHPWWAAKGYYLR